MGCRGSCLVLLAVVGLFSGAGCGPGGTRRAVTGSVTYQGQPLESGTITFLSTGTPPGPVGGALINAGRYELPAAQGLDPGNYRVAISSPVPGGTLTAEEKAAGASPRAQERIPPQYNAATTLEAEVTAAGPNRFNFDLP